MTELDDVDVVVAKLMLAGMPGSLRQLVLLVLRLCREQGWMITPPSERNHMPPAVPPPPSRRR